MLTWDECKEAYSCENIIKPEEEALYAPFVEVTFRSMDRVLSVGNESSPSFENSAMLTSFQYGSSTGTGGCGVKFEITDVKGTLYEFMTQGINKDITKALTSPQTGAKSCEVEFGWIVKDCFGGSRKVTNLSITKGCGSATGPLKFMPLSVQTNFENGIIKFVIEGTDLFQRSFDHNLQEALGDDENKKTLKEALTEVFTKKDPQFSSVKFYTKEGKEGLKFKKDDGDEDQGYRSTFTADQESNVSCARKWLNNTRTEEDRGILIIYDPCDNSIIIHESPEIKDCCENSVGTYIVNGGNESPVLSFNPSIKWPLGANAGSGGTSGGSASGNNSHLDNKANENSARPTKRQNAGAQIQGAITQDQNLWRTPEIQAKKTLENTTAHNEATKFFEGTVESIEAELKVMGDPRYSQPLFLTGRWLSLVVIDPYYLQDYTENTPCTWIEKPYCDPILSNKRWMIGGVDHQITSGSYVTTFKLHLFTPNVDWAGGSTLSGCGKRQALESDDTEPRK